MMKRNDGFTLIELIISIAIGTLITAAALSTLLFGMRINAKTSENVKQLNTTNMLVQVLQNVAESKDLTVIENGNAIKSSDDSVTLTFADGAILLNGTEFMTDVEDFYASMSPDNRLLTIELNNGEYKASVYCRLNTPIETDAQ